MPDLGSAELPLRIAIVGSGPSGFYAADALVRSGLAVSIDILDRLPTPFGLVRGGVAPDHPKIKNVIRVYDRIARGDAVRFLGNVMLGRDVSIEELHERYDAVLLTSGAEADKRLGIPGEDLPGSHTATEFVGWYNAHPDFRERSFDLGTEVAVVVGQGNVAMDVSRILAKTVEELQATDIAAHALEALAASRIREIHLLGRRGPVQAKFTPPEIKEIGELADCEPVIDPSELALDAASQAELADPDQGHARQNLEILQAFASRPPSTKRRRYVIRNFVSPVEILGTDRVEAVVVERNELVGEPGNLRARGTGERTEIPCGLVFRSIGYTGRPTPGLPFDERAGVVPNQGGRVVGPDGPLPGLYVAGWIKRGPTGVIGTNKPDAGETVQALLADVPQLVPCRLRDAGALEELVRSRNIRPVSFEDWLRIDAVETERGRGVGKPREKFATIEEMLEVLPPE